MAYMALRVVRTAPTPWQGGSVADIKLKDLRYLVAIADTGHFGKAAERCFVSQPTLSAQLRKLEDYLGVVLVERQPRQALLTPAGAEIVARARRIVEASDEVVEIARTHRDPLAGRLRIAFLPTIGPYLLPGIAPRLHRALPRLELMFYEHQTAPMLERLHAGDIDLGVLALPIDLDGLVARPLYDEPFVVAAPAAHPLAARKQVRIEDLRGVTLLPELATRGAYASARGVAVRPFVRPAPIRRIGAVWRKSSPRTAALAAVAAIIAEHAL